MGIPQKKAVIKWLHFYMALATVMVKHLQWNAHYVDWFWDVGGIWPNLNITFRKPENFTTQFFYIKDAPYPQFLYLDTNFLKALQLWSSCSWLLRSHPTAALKPSSGKHRDGALNSFLSVLWTLEGTKCDQFYQWTPLTLPRHEKIVLGKLYQSVKPQLTKELGREDGGHSESVHSSRK